MSAKSLQLLVLLSTCCSIFAQDSCCATVRLSTTGVANASQAVRFGLYERVDTHFDRPVYQHESINEYLFYMGGRARGLWMVGPQVGFFSGGLAHRGQAECVEDAQGSWKFADGTGWTPDPDIKAQCQDDKPECLYADETNLVGEGSTLNQEPILVTKTADCIDACVNTWGCRYWTVTKSSTPQVIECFLKSWRGRRVQDPGFISGSLPSACYHQEDSHETASPELERPETRNPCVYQNLEFKGGDLSVIPSLSFDRCKAECQKLKDCSFFSINKVACILKDSKVEIRSKDGVVSGATDQTCEEVLQHKSKKEKDRELDKRYNENEVDGKFRITSEQWSEKLEDSASPEYQELTTTLKTGLKELLLQNDELSKKADFDVEIVKLTKGSVVCNFKIRYVLKEAFVAVPFDIKPSNITVTLGQGFEFKTGILFQRFVIARGSFKASSPVDHCDAKGCSHKCAYDYELEDYMCTCPPNLLLSDDDKTCREAIEDGSEVSSTTQSAIAVQLLPTDCLWSEWSDWSPCSATCGEDATRARNRKVIIPARNGGQCSGSDSENWSCQFKPCDEDDEVEFGAKVPAEVSSTTVASTASTRNEPRAFSFDTTIPEDMLKTEASLLAEATTEKSELEATTEAPLRIETTTLMNALADMTTADQEVGITTLVPDLYIANELETTMMPDVSEDQDQSTTDPTIDDIANISQDDSKTTTFEPFVDDGQIEMTANSTGASTTEEDEITENAFNDVTTSMAPLEAESMMTTPEPFPGDEQEMATFGMDTDPDVATESSPIADATDVPILEVESMMTTAEAFTSDEQELTTVVSDEAATDVPILGVEARTTFADAGTDVPILVLELTTLEPFSSDEQEWTTLAIDSSADHDDRSVFTEATEVPFLDVESRTDMDDEHEMSATLNEVDATTANGGEEEMTTLVPISKLSGGEGSSSLETFSADEAELTTPSFFYIYDETTVVPKAPGKIDENGQEEDETVTLVPQALAVKISTTKKPSPEPRLIPHTDFTTIDSTLDTQTEVPGIVPFITDLLESATEKIMDEETGDVGQDMEAATDIPQDSTTEAALLYTINQEPLPTTLAPEASATEDYEENTTITVMMSVHEEMSFRPTEPEVSTSAHAGKTDETTTARLYVEGRISDEGTVPDAPSEEKDELTTVDLLDTEMTTESLVGKEASSDESFETGLPSTTEPDRMPTDELPEMTTEVLLAVEARTEDMLGDETTFDTSLATDSPIESPTSKAMTSEDTSAEESVTPAQAEDEPLTEKTAEMTTENFLDEDTAVEIEMATESTQKIVPDQSAEIKPTVAVKSQDDDEVTTMESMASTIHYDDTQDENVQNGNVIAMKSTTETSIDETTEIDGDLTNEESPGSDVSVKQADDEDASSQRETTMQPTMLPDRAMVTGLPKETTTTSEMSVDVSSEITTAEAPQSRIKPEDEIGTQETPDEDFVTETEITTTQYASVDESSEDTTARNNALDDENISGVGTDLETAQAETTTEAGGITSSRSTAAQPKSIIVDEVFHLPTTDAATLNEETTEADFMYPMEVEPQGQLGLDLPTLRPETAARDEDEAQEAATEEVVTDKVVQFLTSSIQPVNPESTTIMDVPEATTTSSPSEVPLQKNAEDSLESTTHSVPLLVDDEDDEEVLEVEGESTLDEDEEGVHTLKCLPDSNTIDESGMMQMNCQDQNGTVQEPITVIISADGLDLGSLVRKNVKIVVKDYMLMEMQQRAVSLKPRRR